MKMKNPLKKLRKKFDLKKLMKYNHSSTSLENIVKEEFKIYKNNIKELINSNKLKKNYLQKLLI